jgi:hypothetical protein
VFEKRLADAAAADDKSSRGKRNLDDKDGQHDEDDEMDIDDAKPTGRIKRTLMGMMRPGGS